MKNKTTPQYLDDADQSVKNFMASIFDTFSTQIKADDEPSVTLEYFGAVMEVRLVSFEGVYGSQENREKAS